MISLLFLSSFHPHTDSRSHYGIEPLKLDYDWTYTTLYNGTLVEPAPETSAQLAGHFSSWERSPVEINVPLLMKREPILWFTEVILFEDELHDNGVSKLYLKAVSVFSTVFPFFFSFCLHGIFGRWETECRMNRERCRAAGWFF